MLKYVYKFATRLFKVCPSVFVSSMLKSKCHWFDRGKCRSMVAYLLLEWFSFSRDICTDLVILHNLKLFTDQNFILQCDFAKVQESWLVQESNEKV